MMKHVLPLLFLPLLLVSACGGSSSQPSAFCQSVDTVKTDINNLKSIKGNFSIGAVTAELQKLQADVNSAIAQTKNTAGPQVSALKSSMNQLKSTLTKVKDKTETLSTAIPTIKSEAAIVQQNWQALTTAMKC
jgi:hypothetical protein